MCVSSFLKSTVYDKLSKGKDPKGLLDISQAKHVWVSDLKWFSLQLGHAWHTQQGELVVPLRSEDRWQGSWAIGGVSESPLYSDLKLFGEKFCIQLQPPAVDCFGHCLILCSFMAFGKRFLRAYPWIILLPLQITYGFCFQQVECQLHESAKWALLNITLKFKWERREVRGGGFQDASLFTNESSRWLGKLCSSWVKFGIAHAKSVFVFIQLV